MAVLHFTGIGISGLSAAVPAKVIDNLSESEFFTEKEAKSIVKVTGIRERRAASSDICASDLCYKAAEQLLTDMDIDRNTVDILIFISQTPDYRMPATGIILQDRLGLPKSTAAFDVNLGCSGFIYGLAMAYSFCQQDSVRKVLLLNGETRTKVYSAKDKGTGLLFGDAGSAVLIEKREETQDSWISLNADGKRSNMIMIPSGGYRNPSSPESLIEKTHPDGSIRNDEQGIMDGQGVFDFTITDIPTDIKKTLEISGFTIEDIDFFLLHQANKFITDHIAKKMGIPLNKVPYCLQRFGNTSSVSIPLTMVSEASAYLCGANKRLLMCGFGVGLSWGTAIITLAHPHISDLIEL